MSLRDREPKPARPRRSYRLEGILEGLEEADREALEGWLGDLRFSPETIKKELDAEGLYISEGAIARYRTKILKVGTRKGGSE